MTRRKTIAIISSVVIIGGWFFVADGFPLIGQYFTMQRALRSEIHPVWREIQSGNIKEGQSIDQVLKLHKPTNVDEYGPYTVLYFEKDHQPNSLSFSGLSIVAKDEIIVSALAESCTWTKSFFDEMTLADHEQLSRFMTEPVVLRAVK